MGFLDKLFGGGTDVLEKIKDFAENAAKEVSDAAKSATESTQTQTNERYSESDSSPFGVSWGTRMPAEENQYNSNKPYDEYFYDIFREAFPTYQISNEKIRKGRATMFTFYNGGIKELVVEVMSENSTAVSVRTNCRKENVPYLRFYYNHEGWWNTKKYVLNRVRNALGMAVQD